MATSSVPRIEPVRTLSASAVICLNVVSEGSQSSEAAWKAVILAASAGRSEAVPVNAKDSKCEVESKE